ncbi:MAG: hypothetical protein A2Y12_05530 [Planctomycetes bacterium GWF2_42_9]|nr:MAG: hypothetical protein A2Y12_05530 [Planctomycetes bacterium GWF2_42_9]
MSRRHNKKKVVRVIKKQTGYDIEMIHDFLEHLKWELQIIHFENQQDKFKENPELVEQLAKYVKKRHTKALMPATVIQKDKFDSESLAELKARLRKDKLEQMQAAINAFEILEPIFSQALTCAKYPDKLPARIITPDEVINGFIDEHASEL